MNNNDLIDQRESGQLRATSIGEEQRRISLMLSLIAAEFSRDAEKRANSREDGIYLDDLKPGEELDLSTAHHHYHLVKQDESHVRISGHPMYCPQPGGRGV